MICGCIQCLPLLDGPADKVLQLQGWQVLVKYIKMQLALDAAAAAHSCMAS